MTSKTQDGAELLLRQASANTSALIVLQFFSRIVTFALNAAIVRLTAPAVLGVATLKLELFHNTVLFLAREGLRMALLRYTPHSDSQRWLRSLFHMSLLAVPCGVPVVLFFLLAFAYTVPQEVVQAGLVARFWASIAVYALAATVDLFLEPFYMLCVHRNILSPRLKIESLALAGRAAAVLFTCYKYAAKDTPSLAHDLSLGLFAFSLGQIVQQLVLVIGLYGLFRKHCPQTRITELLPYTFVEIDETVLQHALDMTKQTFLKYILSQGDMWIISLVAPLEDQGIYAVVTNYGSLVCRLLLHPVEEAALSFFSQSLSDEALITLASTASLSHDERKRQIAFQRNSALRYFVIVLKADQLLSLFTVAFGTFMAKPFVGTVLGMRWPETAMSLALSTYCLLIPAMAFSGILEAFMHATLTRSWVKVYQGYSVLSTVIYVIISVFLTKAWGPVGLLFSNIISFFIRIAYGGYYLSWYLKRHELAESYAMLTSNLQLRPALYAGFFVAALLNGLSHYIFWPSTLFSIHTLLVASTLAACLYLLLICERPFLLLLKSMYVDRKSPNAKD